LSQKLTRSRRGADSAKAAGRPHVQPLVDHTPRPARRGWLHNVRRGSRGGVLNRASAYRTLHFVYSFFCSPLQPFTVGVFAPYGSTTIVFVVRKPFGVHVPQPVWASPSAASGVRGRAPWRRSRTSESRRRATTSQGARCRRPVPRRVSRRNWTGSRLCSRRYTPFFETASVPIRRRCPPCWCGGWRCRGRLPVDRVARVRRTALHLVEVSRAEVGRPCGGSDQSRGSRLGACRRRVQHDASRTTKSSYACNGLLCAGGSRRLRPAHGRGRRHGGLSHVSAPSRAGPFGAISAGRRSCRPTESPPVVLIFSFNTAATVARVSRPPRPPLTISSPTARGSDEVGLVFGRHHIIPLPCLVFCCRAAAP